jgi:Ring finger domain
MDPGIDAPSERDGLTGTERSANERRQPFDAVTEDANVLPCTVPSATRTIAAAAPENKPPQPPSVRRERVLWFLNANVTQRYKSVRQCYVKDNPLVALQWNETTNRYQQAVANRPPESNSTNSNSTNTTNNSSSSSRTENDPRLRRIWRSLSIAARRQQQEEEDSPAMGSSQSNGTIVYGRLCPCASELLPESASNPQQYQRQQYYCPDIAPICRAQVDRPGSSQAVLTVSCVNTTNTLAAKYLFPLSLFLLAFYAVLCYCSPKGLAARLYWKKRGCRRWKESDDRFEAGLHDELEWMLQRQRVRHEMVMAQRQLNQEHRQSQQPRPPPPPPPPPAPNHSSSVPTTTLPPPPLPPRDGEARGAASTAARPLPRNLHRVLIPGSTPYSALLLEVSNRQHRRHEGVELVPVPASSSSSAAGVPAVAAREEQATSPDAHGGTSQQNVTAPTMVLLKTRQYDGFAAPKTNVSKGRANVVAACIGGGSDTGAASERVRVGDCTCSICLTDLALGDRVGDLPCRHLFHAKCLKDWIRRRNRRCPLCMAAIPLAPKVAKQPLTVTSTSIMSTEPTIPTSRIT